ncbi:uncharacterized protein LDX57_006743 [Aspergillus melleus]|uniref:uncharacterized protein n=1 Tax=Aspergillus melleus TaxID=138277 RepID=UPI001E8CF268|nr:uncharacterized protein LDX57_006743 [Aspergillus melleus]KAH8429073.1 hypothetical protein LDX57_006743 [Aspergillus melleus]
MHGPTVATVPVAIRLNYEETKKGFLSEVQAQMHEMIPFQHFKIERISGLNSDTRYACQFQNLLVIQSTPDESSVLGWERIEAQTPDLFNYGITVGCEPGQDSQTLTIRVHFDPQMITAMEVETLVHHFERAISQLNQGPEDLSLGQISLLGPYDHSKISEWNRKGPPPPV